MNERSFPSHFTADDRARAESVAAAMDRLGLPHNAQIVRARSDAGTLLRWLCSEANSWLYLACHDALTAALATSTGRDRLEHLAAQRNLEHLANRADQLALVAERRDAIVPPAPDSEVRPKLRLVVNNVPRDMAPTVPPPSHKGAA